MRDGRKGQACARPAHDPPDTLLATQAKATRPTIKLDRADSPDEAEPDARALQAAGARRRRRARRGVHRVQIEPLRRRVALKVIKLGMDTRQVVAAGGPEG